MCARACECCSNFCCKLTHKIIDSPDSATSYHSLTRSNHRINCVREQAHAQNWFTRCQNPTFRKRLNTYPIKAVGLVGTKISQRLTKKVFFSWISLILTVFHKFALFFTCENLSKSKKFVKKHLFCQTRRNLVPINTTILIFMILHFSAIFPQLLD